MRRSSRQGQSFSPFAVDQLEERRHFASHPVGINFNDEALWSANFSTAVQQSKALGVTSVRLWLSVHDWNERPRTTDSVPAFGTDGSKQTNYSPSVLKRIFDLDREGFSVMLTVVPDDNAGAPTYTQAQSFFRHLLQVTESPTSSKTIEDAVDLWEIGNEPDHGTYWYPTYANKTAGLKSYVNQYLIPVADVLHDPARGVNEIVVSAGPSYNPNDLKIILDEVKLKGRLDTIDYVGYHPYGQYDESQGIDQIATRLLPAKQHADAVGKKMMATEWNIRGFGTDGTKDARWAAAMDQVYRKYILPNFEANYFFALINNWSARGGTTSARPGSVLKHTYTGSISTSSSIATTKAYYESPVVPANPFYNTYNAWQYGQLSGSVLPSPSGGTAVPQTTVFIDVNNNGAVDSNEPSTLTGTNGAFTLKYSSRIVPKGNYTLRAVTPTGWTPGTNTQSVALAYLKTQTGVNFTFSQQTQPPPPPPPPPGPATRVSGLVWRDDNANQAYDFGESTVAGTTVYLDLDNDNVNDALEPSAITDSAGAYAVEFDPANYTAGSAYLRVVVGTESEMTTAAPVISLTSGDRTDVNHGLRAKVVTPPPPTVTGSISGVLWNDTDSDGIKDTGEAITGSRTVYNDANRNGKRDAGEQYTTSASNGNYTLSGLAAGTYYVTREFPAGYYLSGSTTGHHVVTLAAGQIATNVNIGSTTKPPTTTNPPPPPPPTNGTASIRGTLFAALSSTKPELWSKSPKVFVDANKNGLFDTGESSVAVKADWTYDVAGLAAGTFRIAMVPITGWKVNTPTARYYDVTLTTGKIVTGKNFVMAKA